MGVEFKFFVSGALLLIAVLDDLKSRKIHNKLLLALLPVVLGAVWALGGVIALKEGGVAACVALAIGMPLWMARAIGGGDVKLLALLALSFHWQDFLRVFLYSLPWALLLGIFKILLEKKGKDFLINLLCLIQFKKQKKLKFHTIPFSIALFMAWLSFMSWQHLDF